MKHKSKPFGNEIWQGKLLLYTLAIVNFLLKIWFLGSNSLAGDEPFSVYHAQLNCSTIISELSKGNNPPLFELILHFWIKFAGISEFAVRIPSLVFSSITVGYLFLIGDRYFNRRVAVYAACIFIFSNYHIYFAHEARVYALLGMLTAVSMYYFLQLFEGNQVDFNRQKVIFSLLILCNTFIIYAHYFGFLVLIVQSLFLLWNFQKLKRYWKGILISFLLIFLFYLPNLFVLLHRFYESSNGTWVEAPNGFVSIYNMLWLFSNAPVVTVVVIAVLIASLVKFAILRLAVDHLVRFILFWFCFVFFGMFVASYKAPMFMDRYLMVAAIAFPLLVAIAVDFLIIKPRFRIILPVILLALFAFTCKPNLTNRRNAREAIAQLKKLQTEQSIVYFCPDRFDLNFIYYYDRSSFKKTDLLTMNRVKYANLHEEEIFPVTNAKDLDIQKIQSKSQVIYFEDAANFHYPENRIKETLDSLFGVVNTYHFRETFNIYIYSIDSEKVD